MLKVRMANEKKTAPAIDVIGLVADAPFAIIEKYLCDDRSNRRVGSIILVTVASYRRRRHHLLVEEVPGLYIRRLTLEDPKSARERPNSRSQSPTRHICHPRSSVPPGRRTSRTGGALVSRETRITTSISHYDETCNHIQLPSWLDRSENDGQAFLTITSLELPDCPIPLIDSQASARWRTQESVRSASDKDAILEKLLNRVAGPGREEQSVKDDSRKGRQVVQQGIGSPECIGGSVDLEESTRSAVEGTDRAKASEAEDGLDDCTCSEISENLRINIRKKTEVRRSSRSPSPEVTHIIRIAMKYHGQPECEVKNENEGPDSNSRDSKGNGVSRKLQTIKKDQRSKEEDCCVGVNVALDFTLNCSSVKLTSRDISVKAATRNSNKSKERA